MPTIAEIRQKYPQYERYSDSEIADAFHRKYYADEPKWKVYESLGLTAPEPEWNPENTPQQVAFDTVSKVGKMVVEPFLHPIDTVTGLAKAVAHPIDTVKQVGTQLADNFGTPEKAKRTFYEDPSGVLSGAAMLAPTAVGVAKTGKWVANQGAKIARNPEALMNAARGAGLTAPIDAAKSFFTRPGKVAAVGRLDETGVMPEGRLTSLSPAARIADEQMYKAMTDAGWDASRVAAKERQLGDQAMMADQYPFTGLAEATAVTPEGLQRARRDLELRAKGAEKRLLSSVRENMSADDYYGTLKVLNEGRNAKATPLYQKAFSDDKPLMSDALDEMRADPRVLEGINHGLTTIKIENAGIPASQKIPLESAGVKFNSAGDPVYTGIPTLRALDAGVRGLDDMIEVYRNKVGKLQLDERGKALVGLRKRLNDELIALTGGKNGVYAQAKEAWAGPSRLQTAVKMGRDLLDNDPEINRALIESLSPQERQYVKIGLSREIQDRMRENPQAAVRFFERGVHRDQIESVFTKPDGTHDRRAFHQFERDVLREATKQQTRNRNIAGSATAQRTEAKRSLQSASGMDPDGMTTGEAAATAFDAASRNPVGVLRRVGNVVSKEQAKKAEKLYLAAADEASSVLHSRDPLIARMQRERFRRRAMPPKPPQEPYNPFEFEPIDKTQFGTLMVPQYTDDEEVNP